MAKSASANGDLQRALAAYILSINVGQRVASVRELARANRSSVGSVSKALNDLADEGAIQIERRGHLGSFLLSRDVGELWQIAEEGPLIVSFPLPSSLLLEGLATALKTLLARTGIDVYLTFIRGSRTRLKALRASNCHMAVMSGFAAKELVDSDEEIFLALPPRTYVNEHMVFYRQHRTDPTSPLRVGVDWDSFDIYRLVELEFSGQAVEYKPMSYMQIPRLLNDDVIDAGLWSIDDMEPYLGDNIRARPLSDSVQRTVADTDTSATLVLRSTSAAVRAVLAGSISDSDLVIIQQKVISGEVVPEY